MSNTGYLTLSNGEVFQGKLLGQMAAEKNQVSGQMVFTTAMTGYTETLTDPSYWGQLITFAYPLLGNYGVPQWTHWKDSGFESPHIHAAGMIIQKLATRPSHWSSQKNLNEWLCEHQVVGLEGIDTRLLVQKITKEKNLLAAISREPLCPIDFQDPNTKNILSQVSTSQPRTFGESPVRVGVIDCGVKLNIIRTLVAGGCQVELIPWSADFSSWDVDGWVISNGPGDPEHTGDLPQRVRKLLEVQRPVLGICLGFQIMALALGGKTRRLPFGHRGFNQPVQLVGEYKAYLTSQNHGFVVESLGTHSEWEAWFTNANDESLEGVRHKNLPLRGVQFHPESSGGPNDTLWILQDFIRDVKIHHSQKKTEVFPCL